MDPRIKSLESTTFFGERLSRRQIASIQETVEILPSESRRWLARTVCEDMGWRTAGGELRVQFCLRVLERLEELGIVSLPEKRRTGGGRARPAARTAATDPGPPVDCPLSELEPVSLELAAGGLSEWTELVDRYHPRGYRSPIRRHLAYFVVDGRGRRLGCLMFEEAPGALACRDDWIGWTPERRGSGLELILRNTRFLILPWVSVRNLASRALALASRRVAGDWEERWGLRPAMAETFVDPADHDGACYRAAGWERIGASASKPAKDVYARGLERGFREILRDGRKAAAARIWSEIAAAAAEVAERHDRKWRVRRRVVGTFLAMMFVFRLACGEGRSYARCLDEFWEHCRASGIPLPQASPVTPAAMCRARAKVAPEAFRELHREILARAGGDGRWKGRRIFGVDGARADLPRELLAAGYETPGERAHYPQGLVSCLYDLRTRMPFDFELSADLCERGAALGHMRELSRGDVVVYDRGYYSYETLLGHASRGQDAVFRLKKNAFGEVKGFLAGAADSREVEVAPDGKALKELRRKHPGAEFAPLRIRLVKYRAGKSVFALGTTLAEADGFAVADLAELYRMRWRIEEYCKTAKWFMRVEDFRARSEDGVRQELYAGFCLIAMTRLLAGEVESGLGEAGRGKPPIRINFKNGIGAVWSRIEALMIRQADAVETTVLHLCEAIAASRWRERAGRSYARRSRKPLCKWARKGASKASKA